MSPQIVKSPNGCLDCGACLRYAQQKNGSTVYTPQSIRACPNHLLRVVGESLSPEELTGRLLKNADLLQRGGVTFSGGEPLLQGDFLKACLTLLQGKVHTAVQTCGYCDGALFEQILERADYFLFDLKLMDDEKHRRYTGVSNAKIQANFARLVESGKDFVPRIPLIPGVTDTEENLTQIACLLREKGISYAELMSYNKMAGGKYAMVGREFAPDFDDSAQGNPRNEIFEKMAIAIKIL